jgi:Flp pilus assembly protein TadD
MLRLRSGVVVSLGLFVLPLWPIGLPDSAVWDSPRFGTDGATLYKAASQSSPKEGADVVVLDEEESYVFDSDGKALHTHYLVYKVLTQKGAEGWDGISVAWQPWHEERPTMRARVVTPDNAIHGLDPNTITDAPARDDDDKTYGDGRILRAPLPAIAPGSVVEEEEVSKERAALFGAGVVVRNYFGRMVPVRSSKLVIEAPSSMPLHYAIRLLPDMKPQKAEANGRLQLVFVQGPMEALDKVEDYLPTEMAGQPQVTFATGASWQAVAEGYGKIIDEKASPKDVQSLVSGLVAGKASREDKAAAIVRYLSREVRYTGVEFGDAAIIPHSPAETLKRKYGDCKDKATLAVAMLRAAGIPSYVALLNAGSRHDVEANLPGMGLFDHAIVYLPGHPDFWIDPTDEYARLGQLPPSDQGRLALIVRGENTGLVPIPEASSQDNRIIEKREFYLAENGPARVVETTEPHGVFESEFRLSYADPDDKESRKTLKDYIANEYLSERLERINRSDPDDFSKQLQLVIEAGQAKRGYTDLDSASAAIRLESLFYRLPEELKQRQTEAEKSDDAGKKNQTKPRNADFQLPQAFVNEWQYRFVPPLGFQAKPLPPGVKMAMGPAELTESFLLEADGSVKAVLRFDTVKRRYTAEEARELREKVASLREGPAILIYFEPTTQALMNQGKMREAFQASRDFIALHPKEAVHHLQRAKALLSAGMGEAAREEARTAVKLEPSSALAQKTLAEILEFDLVGRQYRRGSDFAGAETAFRAARKLDPEDKEIVGNLAIFLEFNHEGDRYGPGAKMKEAVAEYRSLAPEQLAKIGLKNNLAYALFYAGDFAGAKKNAESLNPQPNNVIVACEAALNGFEAGMKEGRQRTGNENELKGVLGAAGELLMRARKYALAADLMAAGASGNNASKTMALSSMLRKAQRHEEMKVENSPAGVVLRMFLITLDPEITVDKMRAIFSRNAQKVLRQSDPETLEKMLNAGRQIRSSLSRTGFPADVMLDVVIPAIATQTEGNDASGYKVTLRPAGANKMSMWVVKEDGNYKILDSAEKPNAIGLEILDRLQAGSTAEARVLLDSVRDEEHLPGGDDPLAGFAFPRMWAKGKEADVEQMTYAAAAILSQTKETSRDAVKILEAGEHAAKNDTDMLNFALALLSAYENLEQYEKLHALAGELAQKFPESKRLFFEDETALRALGRFDDADAVAREMAKRLPDDVDVKRAFIHTAAAREDYARAHELGRELINTGKAEGSDMNAVAWNSLFTGKVTQEDLEVATKSAQITQNNSAAVLHTLGCVYAEIGKTKEAREILVQAMDLLNLDEPESSYWYGFGRVAEQYGERAVASSDYNQVKKPTEPTQMPGSSYRLAQNRLTALANSK